MEWYVKVLKQYADFNGRARRKEYWMFFLINFLISMAIGFVSGFIGGMSQDPSMASGMIILPLLYSLGVLIPSIAVGVRRLHDTNRSGWWLLVSLVPIIGAIVLIVFLVQDSQPGSNQYGPNPKGVETAVEI